MTLAEQIREFMRNRPHTLEDATFIAETMCKEGTPFCRICRDWHYPNEDHSGS